MVRFEEALERELKNPRSKGFINQTKLSMNYQQISCIAPFKYLINAEKEGFKKSSELTRRYISLSYFSTVRKLFLSHNNLRSLEGLEYFTSLTHLSISYNKIYDMEELQHVPTLERLESLSIEGNFFAKHPGIIYSLSNDLKILDGKPIGQNNYFKEMLYLRKIMIPLWYKLEKAQVVAEEELRQIKALISEGTILEKDIGKNRKEIIDLQQFYHKSDTNLKSLLKTCKGLYIHYKHHSFDVDKRSELFILFKDIFQEIVLSLNQMKTTEMIQYINYAILRDNDDLFEYLKQKVLKEDLKAKRVTNANVDQVVDLCISHLQSDDNVNYSVLVIEQLKQFYNLQPNQVSLWDESLRFYEDDDISEENSLLQSELQELEERCKGYDSFQSGQSEGPFVDSCDKEIIPQPSYNGEYDNKKNRLKLDIMDLQEEPNESDSEEEQARQNEFLEKKDEIKRKMQKDKFKRFLVDYSHNFDMRDDYKRFFRKDNFDYESDDIFNQTLYEFPVFGCNEAYCRALSNIISIKVKQIYNLKKKGIDILDRTIGEQNHPRPICNDLMQRDDLEEFQTIGTLEREIPIKPKPNKGLTYRQRAQVEEEVKKLKRPEYKTNLKKFEEVYLIPQSNNKQVNVSDTSYYESKRNAKKVLNKMCKTFTKYNNRLSKCKSFLALKLNAAKPKAASMLHDSLSRIFQYGYCTTIHKESFIDSLKEICQQRVEDEHEYLNEAKSLKEQRLKQRSFGALRTFSEVMQQQVEKYHQFYCENLKIKSFFTLLRYARKKKKMREEYLREVEQSNSFILERFFKLWRKAYKHRMNQLENKRCFKVKFSDYCKCKDCMIEQRACDIKPEFDKFTSNPYPKVSTLLNTSKEQEEESEFLNISKSSHPFAKYANPSSRADIKPVFDDSREVVKTDCTIRTLNENENVYNPFNKFSVKDTLSTDSPKTIRQTNNDGNKSMNTDTMNIVTNPYYLNNSNKVDSIKDSQKYHRFLEVDSSSQKMHPHSSTNRYESGLISKLNKIEEDPKKKTQRFHRPNIPKGGSSKTSTVRFCSSKKKKSKQKRFSKAKSQVEKGTNFTNKLIKSIESIEMSSKMLNDTSPYREIDRFVLAQRTQNLLGKYEKENDNKRILSPEEKALLKQRALSSGDGQVNFLRDNGIGSLTPSSLIDSSTICKPLMPVFKGMSNQKNDSSVLDYEDQSATEKGGGAIIVEQPPPKVTVRDSSRKSSKSKSRKSTKSPNSKTKTRSRQKKNKSVWNNSITDPEVRKPSFRRKTVSFTAKTIK
ncbi:unnamed protein product [Moneuplotes crassus]|uniref:Uncharacterized protein n=1 Tax=Euplotes crassus TaxID=5936 RepID=A0AAD1UIB9_EUPCR|nr:unnamed protein product [Moneuplotes crassus]